MCFINWTPHQSGLPNKCVRIQGKIGEYKWVKYHIIFWIEIPLHMQNRNPDLSKTMVILKRLSENNQRLVTLAILKSSSPWIFLLMKTHEVVFQVCPIYRNKQNTLLENEFSAVLPIFSGGWNLKAIYACHFHFA